MSSDPWQQLVMDFTPIVMSIIGLLLSWALLELKNYLKSKIKNEAALTALNTVDNIVQTVVADVRATVKADLERAREDGKVTKEEGIQIKNHALERINALVPAELKKSLGPMIANFEKYISSKIEEEVERTK